MKPPRLEGMDKTKYFRCNAILVEHDSNGKKLLKQSLLTKPELINFGVLCCSCVTWRVLGFLLRALPPHHSDHSDQHPPACPEKSSMSGSTPLLASLLIHSALLGRKFLCIQFFLEQGFHEVWNRKGNSCYSDVPVHLIVKT